MIPLIDDYLQGYLVQKIKFLKKHPKLIDLIFYANRRETLSSLTEFIVNRPIRVILGYPKDQTSLPCYVITLAPENEVPFGLGDGHDEFVDDLGLSEVIQDEELHGKVDKSLKVQVDGTYMNSNYRIECWSDNGDLTTYMYAILKWCIMSSRAEMLSEGFVNITISGTDLEPVPDYLPVFIYRRSLQVNLQYENHYFKDLNLVKESLKVLENPDDFKTNSNGDIVDKNGNVIVSGEDTWILRPHYYSEKLKVSDNT